MTTCVHALGYQDVSTDEASTPFRISRSIRRKTGLRVGVREEKKREEGKETARMKQYSDTAD